VTEFPNPFTKADYATRMARVVAEAGEVGLDGVLIAPGPDLVWLTGYRPAAITERLTLLFLLPEQRPTLLVPTPERPFAEAADVAGSVDLMDWPDGSDPYVLARELLEPAGLFGISDAAWSSHLLGLRRVLPEAGFMALSDILPMLRAVKDGAELDRLSVAGAAADAAYEEIVLMPFAGRREFEIAADLARLLLDFGHEQVDFAVVGSGPNGAIPHHESGDRLITRGDIVILDFGGLMFGYGSDTTRTVSVGDPPTGVRAVHDVVREAQQAAFDTVRPGATCSEVDAAARAVIADSGYGNHLAHRTGHGIGVTTHEPPYLIKGTDQELQPGMCFSLEPGIYLPGRFGVRIEDIVTVTPTAAHRLNNTTRDLRIVE
jgi:Xaa-Pro aminopeptidase